MKKKSLTFIKHYVLLIQPFWLIMLFASGFSGNLFSAPPIPYDRWNASANGVVSANCPAGFSCTESVSSDDMLQRILVEDRTGQTYIQLILASGAVNNTGRMVYETFTNANSNTDSGIAAKMSINQTGVENIDYSVLLNLGWANSTASPAIDFSQRVTDTYNSGVTLDYSFNYQQNQNNNGSATGYKYGIRQTVRNSAALNGSGSGDVWTFVLRRAGGDFVRAGSAALSGAAGGGMGGGGGRGRALNIDTPAAGANTSNAFTMPPEGYGLQSPAIGFPEDTIIGPGTDNDPPLVGSLPGSRYNVSSNETVSESHVLVSTDSGRGGIISNGNASGPAIPAGRIDVPTGSTRGMGGGGGAGGGTVAWNTGAEVQVIWIGQNCGNCVLSGMGGMGGGNGQFSIQSYENLTTGATALSRALNSATPLTWVTAPFGARPNL